MLQCQKGANEHFLREFFRGIAVAQPRHRDGHDPTQMALDETIECLAVTCKNAFYIQSVLLALFDLVHETLATFCLLVRQLH